AANGKIPMLLQFTARRIATTAKKEENELLAKQLAAEAEAKRGDRVILVLRGMTEGFRGRKDIPAPAGWEAIADKLVTLDKPEIASLTNGISIAFGDPRALAAVRKVLVDSKALAADRLNALTSLVGRDKGLAPILQKLVAEPGLRGPVLRALANYD